MIKQVVEKSNRTQRVVDLSIMASLARLGYGCRLSVGTTRPRDEQGCALWTFEIHDSEAELHSGVTHFAKLLTALRSDSKASRYLTASMKPLT